MSANETHFNWNEVRNRTVKVEDLMRIIALFHDRHDLPGEQDEPLLVESISREYTRGQLELLMDAAGLPQDLKPEMARRVGIDWKE